MSDEKIIEIVDVSKAFKKDKAQDLLVLKDVNFTMNEGEIVALLGKSGSGKSTLLRLIAGLLNPTAGKIYYRNKVVHGPAKGIAMVFQQFALMPWLTVFQNVELGLEALGVPRDERRERTLKAIDTIGLDGFESAYPRELSGGMRQRVGFARALVVNPDLLLMDEPFSALDVLTAENLLTDLMDLWQEKKTNTKGILFVTHDIEEAASVADKILIFGSDPGYIRAEIKIDMPYPRKENDREFSKLVDRVYTLMTTKPESKEDRFTQFRPKAIGLGYRLPDVDLGELAGLLENVFFEHNGRCDLPKLADENHLDVDELFTITEFLEILGFARTIKGDLEMTALGKRFAEADILEKKQLFATHLLKNVPLARRIRKVLDERHNHKATKARFLNELEDYLSEEEADRVLTTAIAWGRYAEIFAYDNNTGMLSLENPD